MKLLKFIPALFILSTPLYALPSALSKTLIAESFGQTYKPVKIESWHSYLLKNDSNAQTSYKLTYTICVPDKRTNPCFTKIENFTVNPNQQLQNTYHFEGTVTFQNPGNHSLNATTEITGASYNESHDYKFARVTG